MLNCLYSMDICKMGIFFFFKTTSTSIIHTDLDTRLNFTGPYVSVRQKKKHNSSEFMNILELLKSGA